MTTLQQLWVILLEPFTEDMDFVLRAFFRQKSLLPQGYEPLSSRVVFQLVRTHTKTPSFGSYFPATAARARGASTCSPLALNF